MTIALAYKIKPKSFWKMHHEVFFTRETADAYALQLSRQYKYWAVVCIPMDLPETPEPARMN